MNVGLSCLHVPSHTAHYTSDVDTIVTRKSASYFLSIVNVELYTESLSRDVPTTLIRTQFFWGIVSARVFPSPSTVRAVFSPRAHRLTM